MKKYLAFFRLRFSMGLQYRSAALAGIVTQFFWGFMEIMAFYAFYQSDSGAFPMSFQATASYIWLQQAFLSFFMAWMMEGELFDAITDGSISYELVRPIRLYHMWFARSLAYRLARGALRCMPILLVAVFLPAPFGLAFPPDGVTFLLFLITLFLGLFVSVAMCMIIYLICFFTISSAGVRMVAVALFEFLSGGIIPIPFFPDQVRFLIELLPFAYMQNTPLRIYSGDLYGPKMWQAIGLQLLWLLLLLLFGRLLEKSAMKWVVVQGG